MVTYAVAPMGEVPGLPPEEIERIRRVLQAAISKVCPAWLADQKEDLVQAAFLKVFKSWKDSEESGPPPTSYVWKAAYSATMDEIRRARVRREEALDDGVQSNPVASDPSRQQRSAEMRRAIVECLRRLEPGRRRAVQLYLSGFGLKETASLLRWNAKRVDNERYRGLAELRRCLTRRGFG